MTTQLDCLFEWAATTAAAGREPELNVTVLAPKKNFEGNCTYAPGQMVRLRATWPGEIGFWHYAPASFSGTIEEPVVPVGEPTQQELVVLAPPPNQLGPASYTVMWAGQSYLASSPRVVSCGSAPPRDYHFSISVDVGGFSGDMIFYYIAGVK